MLDDVMKTYGLDWHLIAKKIPTKSLAQIKAFTWKKLEKLRTVPYEKLDKGIIKILKN